MILEKKKKIYVISYPELKRWVTEKISVKKATGTFLYSDVANDKKPKEIYGKLLSIRVPTLGWVALILSSFYNCGTPVKLMEIILPTRWVEERKYVSW